MLVPKEKVQGYKLQNTNFFIANILCGGSSSLLATCFDCNFLCVAQVSLFCVSKNCFDIPLGFYI
jgi:hypothetical protein